MRPPTDPDATFANRNRLPKGMHGRWVTVLLAIACASTLSCSEEKTTDPPAADDTVPPAAVQDLRVVETYERSLTVAWTAPRDAGPEGRAYRYDLRYAYDPNAAWDEFVSTGNLPPPAGADIDESSRVLFLVPGQRHVFRLKSTDRTGNWSAESNIAIGETEPLGSGPIVIVASEDGVVFSEDAGTTWHSSEFSDHRSQIGRLLPDPADANGVYAGSGLQNTMGDGLSRIYRSSDRGRSWSLISEDAFLSCTSVQSLAASSAVPNLLLAGTDGYCRNGGCNNCFDQAGGVYRSTDGGVTWDDVSSGLPLLNADPTVHLSVHCVLIDPINLDRWYVGMQDLDQGTTNNGLFVSPDAGVTWIPSPIGAGDGWTRVDVHALSIDPMHPQRSVASTDRGIYLSEDAMASWIQVAEVSERRPVIFDPRDSQIVYVGSVQSRDGGRTWTGSTVPAGALADLDLDPETSVMFAVGTGGAFRSNDGVAWNNRTGLPKCTDVLMLGQHRPARANYSVGNGGRQ